MNRRKGKGTTKMIIRMYDTQRVPTPCLSILCLIPRRTVTSLNTLQDAFFMRQSRCSILNVWGNTSFARGYKRPLTVVLEVRQSIVGGFIIMLQFLFEHFSCFIVPQMCTHFVHCFKYITNMNELMRKHLKHGKIWWKEWFWCITSTCKLLAFCKLY